MAGRAIPGLLLHCENRGVLLGFGKKYSEALKTAA